MSIGDSTRWVIIGPSKDPKRSVCRCECRYATVREVSNHALHFGLSFSCGRCARSEGIRRHGLSKTPEYFVWHSVKTRCYDPNHIKFEHYGGRGVRVCERWLCKTGFENFIADMGPRPAGKYVIDRVDTNGDYCPENCKWNTRRESDRNKRNNRRIVYQGRDILIIDLADELGMSRGLLLYRLKSKWSLEEAINTPTNKYKPKVG